MEVKPGYKQTEVGDIPEEWEVKPLGEIGGVRMCKRVLKHQTREHGDVPFYKIGTFGGVADAFISQSLFDEFRRKYSFPRKGDILISAAGTIGRTVAYDGDPAYFQDSNIVWIDNDESKATNAYLWHRYQVTKWSISHGGTVARLYNDSLRTKIHIPIPPLPEQRAIATALSDVDGLLGGLDRLIAKKRDLKQAAMQQLLTGQTRLPGFHGEWEVKRLKQVAEISTGVNKPLSEMGSGALYVTVQDLYDKTSIRTERLSRIKVSPSEIETRSLMVGDVVFGKSSVKRDGIGYPSQFLGCDEPVVFSGFTYRARARQGIANSTFLFYALREERTRRWLIDNSQASALTNINQTIADAIPVQVPPSVPEQTAIASVLSEMDGELAVLEQRREKTRALKQAMMQELLTGRSRLAPSGEL
jgi:type I restriction enzyme S subunit